MPYRMFEDSRGVEWQVWDIVPRLVERRTKQPDRRVDTHVIEFTDRRQHERRIAEVRRARLSGSYAQGWLAFDNGREKRRLTPIPEDWASCPPERLESYAREAQPVPVSGRGTMEPLGRAGEPYAEAG